MRRSSATHSLGRRARSGPKRAKDPLASGPDNRTMTQLASAPKPKCLPGVRRLREKPRRRRPRRSRRRRPRSPRLVVRPATSISRRARRRRRRPLSAPRRPASPSRRRSRRASPKSSDTATTASSRRTRPSGCARSSSRAPPSTRASPSSSGCTRSASSTKPSSPSPRKNSSPISSSSPTWTRGGDRRARFAETTRYVYLFLDGDFMPPQSPFDGGEKLPFARRLSWSGGAFSEKCLTIVSTLRNIHIIPGGGSLS
mmetsp:Transcript_18861/g.75233  ORF Transcript_18861/g.75233 Transcript_18861/m.75233 type:complete len:256 (+) Transcript_18861:722-1489(+)